MLGSKNAGHTCPDLEQTTKTYKHEQGILSTVNPVHLWLCHLAE